MSDDFETTFIVELAPAEVWESLTRRRAERGEDGATHHVLPGFPSLPPLDVAGASGTELEAEPERLLRVRKDDHPCQGTEIAVRLEQAGTGTRVTIVQSGFGAFLDAVGRDTVFAHGQQIANDFRLYLERGLDVPGTEWGWNLGARTRQTPIGVEIEILYPGEGWAERVGLAPGDLLLTLAGIRIHDHPQLWTVLALTQPAGKIDATWARGQELIAGRARPEG